MIIVKCLRFVSTFLKYLIKMLMKMNRCTLRLVFMTVRNSVMIFSMSTGASISASPNDFDHFSEINVAQPLSVFGFFLMTVSTTELGIYSGKHLIASTIVVIFSFEISSSSSSSSSSSGFLSFGLSVSLGLGFPVENSVEKKFRKLIYSE